MNPSHDEQRIRERAYRIWESEGCPQGQEMKHWCEACEQIDAEDTGGRTSEETLDTASGGIESGVAPPMPDRQSEP